MAEKPPDKAGLEKIAEAARKSSSYSKLYLWLRDNHDDFQKLLKETRPNWAGLSEGFDAIGLLPPGGIAVHSVRHTWYRVRRDVAAARQKKTQTAKPAPAVTVSPVRPPESAPPVRAATAEPAATPAPNDPPAAEPDDRVKATLARLRDEMKRLG